MAVKAAEVVLALRTDSSQFVTNLKQSTSVYVNSMQRIHDNANTAASSTRQVQGAVKNLGFQINDLFTSTAGGVDFGRAFAQQAGQILQSSNELGSVGGVVKGLGSAFIGLLNPVGLASLGIVALTGYLVQYFMTGTTEVPKLDDLFKRHAATIAELKESFGQAGEGLKEYVSKSQEVIKAQAEINRMDLTAKLKELATEFTDTSGVVQTNTEAINKRIEQIADQMNRLGNNDPLLSQKLQAELQGLWDILEDGGRSTLEATKQFGPFKAAVDALIASIESGNPNFVAFHNEISRIANEKGASEEVKRLADRARKLSEDAYETERRVKAASGAIETIGQAANGQTSAVNNLSKALRDLAGIAMPVMSDLDRATEAYQRALSNATNREERDDAFAAFQAAQERIRTATLPVPEARPEPYFADPEGTGRKIGEAAKSTFLDGTIDRYVNQVVKAESGGDRFAKNPKSTATGLGQFIDATWLDQFKKVFPQEAARLSDAAILAYRTNADMSRKLIENYAKENAALLDRAGIAVNEAALHLAHFLGPDGAVKVLKAAPGSPISQLLGRAQIEANPSILGGGATAASVISYAQSRAGAYGDMPTAAELEKINALLPEMAGGFKLTGDQVKALKGDVIDFGKLAETAIGGIANALSDGKITMQEWLQIGLQVLQQLFQMQQAGKGIGNIFGGASGGSGVGLLGFLGSLFKFADGTPQATHSGPGRVRGPGGDRTDGILAWLSNDEHVTNAKSARKYRPLLDAINADRLPKFANGTPAAIRMPSIPQAVGRAGSGTDNVQVSVGVRVDQDGNLQAYVDKVSRGHAIQAGRAAVAQSQKMTRAAMPGMMAEAQTRAL